MKHGILQFVDKKIPAIILKYSNPESHKHIKKFLELSNQEISPNISYEYSHQLKHAISQLDYITFFTKHYVLLLFTETDKESIKKLQVCFNKKDEIFFNGKQLHHISENEKYYIPHGKYCEPVDVSFTSLSLFKNAKYYRVVHKNVSLLYLESFRANSYLLHALYNTKQYSQINKLFLKEIQFKYEDNADAPMHIMLSQPDVYICYNNVERILQRNVQCNIDTVKFLLEEHQAQPLLKVARHLDIYTHTYTHDLNCYVPIHLVTHSTLIPRYIGNVKAEEFATCCNKPIEKCTCYSRLQESSIFTPYTFLSLPNNKWIGCEIELDLCNTKTPLEEQQLVKIFTINNALQPCFSQDKQYFFKMDNSCETGFELVTNPCRTPLELLAITTDALQKINKNIVTFDQSDSFHSTGTHFHFDKSWFTDKQHANRCAEYLHKLFHAGFLLQISGRASNNKLRRFSKPTKKATINKYTAFADREKTYEFRFFASTNNIDRFNLMLSFLLFVIESNRVTIELVDSAATKEWVNLLSIKNKKD